MDGDPDSEMYGNGRSLVDSPADNPDKCVIYHETYRDSGSIIGIGSVMIHELGHSQNIGVPENEHCDDELCVMREGAPGSWFCDDCKNDLRKRSEW